MTSQDPSTPPRGRLLVLSGPSGVGKSTVVRALRETATPLWVSVSATTRFPRPGETDKVHYRFVSDAEFDRLVEADELLEWAHFAGHRYGTPAAPVRERLAAGEAVLLEIDLQGARQVRGRMAEALLVFLAPPSWDELVERLTRRGTEAPDVVESRLTTAKVELAAESEFDVTLINSDVDEVCARLVALMTPAPGDGAS